MGDKLEPFDGREVAASTISVTRAGDGLSEALSIEPQEFHHGQTVHVVLECTVGKIVHKQLDSKTPDILVRGHVLVAGVGTIVDREAVEQLVAAQRARNDEAARARELEAARQKGEYTLEEAKHEAAHNDGQHSGGLVAGCPLCDAEKAAEKAEAKAGDVASIADRGKAAGAAKKTTAKKTAKKATAAKKAPAKQ